MTHEQEREAFLDLPPLPKPRTLSRGDEDGPIQLGYTADQMHAYARASLAQPASVPAGWPEAYAAFQGAFDNPLQRRLHGDEFASDAMARMREFNEAMLAAPQAPQPEAQPQWQLPAQRLVQWLHCMSYNDSYFGEPAGYLKQCVNELRHLLPPNEVRAAPSAQAEPQQAGTVTLVGVKADGTEHVLGTATMPPKMRAKELVREMFGSIDEETGDDGAMALWVCEQLIEWMQETSLVVTLTNQAEQGGTK